MKFRRCGVVALVAVSMCAVSFFASAQSNKPTAGVAAKKTRNRPAARPTGDAGAAVTKDEPISASPSRDGGAQVAEGKSTDGGTAFRFSEVEVEGRLKSPQIVYFLRRVRAEFAASDLGHRSFLPELQETRNEPGF